MKSVMKYLKQYEKYNKDNTEKINSLTEEDCEEIEKILFNKFKDNEIEINGNALYFELDILKKEPNKSFIIPIINNFYKEKYPDKKINSRYLAVKFFDVNYKGIINQYKLDRKKEFDIENTRSGKKILLPFEGKLIEVPEAIGHNYIPIKILPIEDLKRKYSRHKRLKTFTKKGLKCVSCPREGKYLIATKDRSGAIHIDLYTEDFELMTVDHIKPKSKGGTYDLENLNPMCHFCNTEKADKY